MRKNGICYIIGAMKCTKLFSPAEGDYVIAADAGYLVAKAHNITLDLVVGDFDSLGNIPNDERVICHPVRKDDTDLLLAVKEGWKEGYRKFRIYGGIGGRLDHTFANIQVLSMITMRDGEGILYSDSEMITVIRDGNYVFEKGCKGIVSVFCLSDTAEGVFETGLSYSLSDASLSNDYPIGVSNEFTGERAEISVRKGMLAIIHTF